MFLKLLLVFLLFLVSLFLPVPSQDGDAVIRAFERPRPPVLNSGCSDLARAVKRPRPLVLNSGSDLDRAGR